MTSAKDTAGWLVHVIEAHGIGNDFIIKLDNLENGEFAYIDDEDGSVYLVTVQPAKFSVAEEEA